MKVIIAGSRNISRSDVRKALELCSWSGFISAVISGTANGADQEGEQWAVENNIEILRFPANWKSDGKKAGPLRNLEMAKNGDGLIAIWDGQSRGTKSMIKYAKDLGLRVFILRIDSNTSENYSAKKDKLDLWELVEERAGILEFEGGYDHMTAEKIAGNIGRLDK